KQGAAAHHGHPPHRGPGPQGRQQYRRCHLQRPALPGQQQRTGVKDMNTQALLAVSFGTSHRDTLEKTIAAIEKALAAAFPERTLRRAFTSGMILRKLEREGTHIDDVPAALERLA